MDSVVSRRRLLLAVRLAFVGLVNCAAAGAANSLAFPVGWLSFGFLAGGALLGILLVSPRRDWTYFCLAVIAGGLAGDLPFGVPLSASLVVSGTACLQAAAIAWGVDRLLGPSFRVQQVSHLLVLLGLGTAIAGAGAIVMALGQTVVHPNAGFFTLCGMSWMTGTLGVLFVTPVVLAWTTPPVCPRQSKCGTELAAFLVTVPAAFILLFVLAPTSEAVLHYLPAIVSFPLLLWALMRFGYGGAVTLALVLAVFPLAVALLLDSSAIGAGNAGLTQRILLVLFFVSLRGLTTTVFAAVISEREEANRKLKQMHETLEGRVSERTVALQDLNEQLQREVAERERAEASLRESESRFRAFINHAPVIAFIKDAEGHYLFGNKTWARQFGVEDETTLYGKTDFDLWPAETAHQFRETDRLQFAQGTVLQTMESGPTPSGETRWWTVIKVPIPAAGKLALLGGIAVDITESKLQDERLRESEARNRALLEAIPDMMFLQNQAGVYLDYHAAHPERLAATPERFLGKPMLEVLPPDFGVLAKGWLDEVVRTGQMATGEYTLWLDGGQRHFEARLVPCGADKVLTIVRDITDRKCGEIALRESEARNRAFLQAIPDLMFLHDRNGVCLDCHAPNPEDLILPRDQLIGKNYHDVLSREHVELFDRCYREVLHTGEMQTLEFSFPIPSGVRQYEARVVRCDDDKVMRLVRDITDRKQAEEALRHSEARVRAIVEAIPDLIVIQDREGVLLDCHAANPDDLVAPREQMIGSNIRQLLPPDAAAAMLASAAQALQTGRTQTLELQGPFQGELRHFEARFVGCETDKVVIFVRDISEQKKAEVERRQFEAKIQQTQKLESLGVLAGGIAHDFNNLLTSVLGYADLALLEVPATGEAADCLNQVKVAARRAADLTRQMLAYSGKGKFVVQPLPLSQTVREMASLLQVSFPKSCELRFRFEKDVHLVDADATQLRQVAMNLILNAAEAVGDNPGVVVVATGQRACDRVYLAGCHLDDDLPAGPYVYLEVADTGCGMRPEVLARIFDPFFTTKFTGRGLGLAAVLGIVRGHRGALRVESQPGRGTTFTVLLPPSSRSQMAPDEVADASAWHGSGAVLVVDDEESVRELARAMLQPLGFTVLTAADGDAGVRVFSDNAERINAILVDMTMPHVDGAATVRALRAVRADAAVIVVSGSTRQQVQESFGDLGLAGFLQKPFHRQELIDVLRAALNGTNGAVKTGHPA